MCFKKSRATSSRCPFFLNRCNNCKRSVHRNDQSRYNPFRCVLRRRLPITATGNTIKTVVGIAVTVFRRTRIVITMTTITGILTTITGILTTTAGVLTTTARIRRSYTKITASVATNVLRAVIKKRI